MTKGLFIIQDVSFIGKTFNRALVHTPSITVSELGTSLIARTKVTLFLDTDLVAASQQLRSQNINLDMLDGCRRNFVIDTSTIEGITVNNLYEKVANHVIASIGLTVLESSFTTQETVQEEQGNGA